MAKDVFDNNLEPSQSRGRQIAHFIIEMIIIVAIMLGIRYYLVKPFYVKGASMEPNFYDHQYLIIDEITYRLSEPKRGDVIVFKYPTDPKQYFIKRVMGLPGEHIKIENGKIYIVDVNGKSVELIESYLPQGIVTDLPLRGYSDIVLGSNEFFVLGDNRSQSLDSRIFGPVKKDYIVGRAWIRAWPLNKITVFETPKTQ
ncbi:MAG: signal peptidase I [Candidatus Buchananbacteria bacterium]